MPARYLSAVKLLRRWQPAGVRRPDEEAGSSVAAAPAVPAWLTDINPSATSCAKFNWRLCGLRRRAPANRAMRQEMRGVPSRRAPSPPQSLRGLSAIPSTLGKPITAARLSVARRACEIASRLNKCTSFLRVSRRQLQQMQWQVLAITLRQLGLSYALAWQFIGVEQRLEPPTTCDNPYASKP